MGPSAVNAIVAIGIFNIPVFARLTRAAALPLWERDFILSARVCGKSEVRISIEHILPNITNLMIVQGTIQFSLGILAEASLSYIGLGAQTPNRKLGPYACGRTNTSQHCSSCSACSRACDFTYGSWFEFDGRWPSRSL